MTKYTRSANVADIVIDDGEALALVGTDVVRLGPIATVIWAFLETGASTDDITAEVRRRFGDPPDADASRIVTALLDDLCDRDILDQAAPPTTRS